MRFSGGVVCKRCGILVNDVGRHNRAGRCDVQHIDKQTRDNMRKAKHSKKGRD